jgi:hypothetical protein
MAKLKNVELEMKRLHFTANTLKADLVKMAKRADRGEADAEKWKKQLEQSLLLLEQVQSELVHTKEESASTAKKLKKRLVVKSVWFRSQLTKLERLLELSLDLDQHLKPEITCPSCLDIFSNPQTLFPCGKQYDHTRAAPTALAQRQQLQSCELAAPAEVLLTSFLCVCCFFNVFRAHDVR